MMMATMLMMTMTEPYVEVTSTSKGLKFRLFGKCVNFVVFFHSDTGRTGKNRVKAKITAPAQFLLLQDLIGLHLFKAKINS